MIKPSTIYNKIERLRRAICAEGNPKIILAWEDVDPKSEKGYSTAKLYNLTNNLRRLIRSEGIPETQKAWDEVEPYVDAFFKSGDPYDTSRTNVPNG